MQTFLPYDSIIRSVQCLDDKRLGKQRVEAKQILMILVRETFVPKHYQVLFNDGWHNHPAVNMWRGYIDALARYHNECINQWASRGYENNMPKIELPTDKVINMPHWFGGPIHASHRAALIKKDLAWYGRHGWVVDTTLGYFWPEGASDA